MFCNCMSTYTWEFEGNHKVKKSEHMMLYRHVQSGYQGLKLKSQVTVNVTERRYQKCIRLSGQVVSVFVITFISAFRMSGADLTTAGGVVAQSVERATPGEEIPGFDSRCGRPLRTGWVGVSIM